MSRPDSELPVVSTTAGFVRGRRWSVGFAFLGIPYAEPPYGERRFAAPIGRRAWEGIRDCDRFGATPQRRPFADVTAIPEPSIPGDDVLNLNVFAPDDRRGQLPVMVWIHGGGFIAGSPASPWYDGASFVRDGIVVVTMSYRLAFEGFGHLPDAPDNRGLLDIILALEWVRDNISQFGGDPENVTIAGQSAGAGAAMHIAAAPSARGLFTRVIAASPGPSDRSLADAAQVTKVLARTLGVSPNRAGFSSVDELNLIDAQGVGTSFAAPRDARQLLRSVAGFAAGAPGPVVDGTLQPRTISDALADGVSADIPLLMGATRDEFSGFVLAHGALLDALDPVDALHDSGMKGPMARAYVDSLPRLPTAALVAQSLTDRMFRRHVAEWSALRRTASAPTFVYDFAFTSGATGLSDHCLDVPFAWDVLGEEHVKRIAGNRPPQHLADQVHGAYVRFVRTGNPEWDGAGDPSTVMTWDSVSQLTDDNAYVSARLLLER
jgi:para-nitrobenzyl esterase